MQIKGIQDDKNIPLSGLYETGIVLDFTEALVVDADTQIVVVDGQEKENY